MKNILTKEESARLDEQIAQAEKRARAQIVLAVVERSDSYPELPWKAFALGASLAGLAAFVLGFLLPYRTSHLGVLVAMAGMLAVGGTCALLSVFLPGFARLFLSGYRSDVEVRQYAQSLFLQREIFTTAERTGILLLVSLFEGRALLLPDSGLAGRLTGEAMRSVIGPMTPSVVRGGTGRALQEALERLCRVLEAASPNGPRGAGDDELPDRVIEEKGA